MPQQSGLEGFLEGLRVAQARRGEQNHVELEQQRLENDRQNREAEIKVHTDQLNEQKRQFDATQKVIAAHAALQHMTTLQDIAKGIRAGDNVPGSTQSPAAQTPTGAGFTPIDASQATSIVHTLPSGEQITVPTQNEQARQAAATFAIANKPVEEAKTREALALQSSKNTENEAGKTADFNRRMFEKSMDDSRNKETLANQVLLESMRARSAENVARINHQGNMFGTLDPAQVQTIAKPYLDGLANGTMSASQVKKDFSEKGLIGGDTAILSSFMGAGMVPPTDAQVKFNANIKPIVDSLPLIQEYINMLPKTTSGLGGVLTGLTHPDMLNPELEAKMKEIKFNIATVAKNLSGDQGQRLQKALLEPAEGGYLPAKGKATSYNVSNFNKLVEVLHSAVDSQLGSLTPAQRANIKTQLGLSGISRLNPDGSPVRQAAPGQVAPIPKSQGPPAAPAPINPGVGVWTPQGIKWQQPQQPQQQ